MCVLPTLRVRTAISVRLATLVRLVKVSDRWIYRVLSQSFGYLSFICVCVCVCVCGIV